MKIIIQFLFCIFFLSWSKLSHGQDLCSVHLDKSFYVTGELIWYKLYLTPNTNDKNVAIKTSLVNANGNTIDDHFNLTNGKTYISGYYQLPFDLNSEVYSLVFSATRSNDSAEEIFGEVFIPIFNDLESQPTHDIVDDSDLGIYNSEVVYDQSFKINIILDKEVYKSREKVKVQIKLRDSIDNPITGNISIAVTDLDIIEGGFTANTVFQGNPINFENSYHTFLENIHVKGNYTKGDGELTPNEILGAYSNSENKFHFIVPDQSTGEFLVEFPNYYNSKSIQFFPYKIDDKDLKINLSKIGKTNTKTLSYNKAVVDYISLSRQRKKLFQRYASLESSIKPKSYATEVAEFRATTSFVVEEYQSLGNVANFLKEVYTSLRMKERKGTYKGAMFLSSGLNSFNNYAADPPIYIVNGYLTRNSDFVARLDLDIVTQIAMMNNPIVIRDEYKIFGSTGVVSLTLKTSDIMLPRSDKEDIYIINGLLAETEFPSFNPGQIKNDIYQPFFRPQLYWNGNLTTDYLGESTIEFYQSDDVSTFKIQVVAQAEDGSISQAQKTYKSIWP